MIIRTRDGITLPWAPNLERLRAWGRAVADELKLPPHQQLSFSSYAHRGGRLARVSTRNSKRVKASQYYRSIAWRARREARLQHDNYSCVICGEPAEVVDHLTYERFGNELMTDLRSLCRDHDREVGRPVQRG